MMGTVLVSSYARAGEPRYWHPAGLKLPATRSHDGRLEPIEPEAVPALAAGELLVFTWAWGYIVYEVVSNDPAAALGTPLWLAEVFPHPGGAPIRQWPHVKDYSLVVADADVLATAAPSDSDQAPRAKLSKDSRKGSKTDASSPEEDDVDNSVDNPVETVLKTPKKSTRRRSAVDKSAAQEVLNIESTPPDEA